MLPLSSWWELPDCLFLGSQGNYVKKVETTGRCWEVIWVSHSCTVRAQILLSYSVSRNLRNTAPGSHILGRRYEDPFTGFLATCVRLEPSNTREQQELGNLGQVAKNNKVKFKENQSPGVTAKAVQEWFLRHWHFGVLICNCSLPQPIP